MTAHQNVVQSFRVIFTPVRINWWVSDEVSLNYGHTDLQIIVTADLGPTEQLKAGVIPPRMKTIERPTRVIVEAAVIPGPATSEVAMPPSAGHASATEVTTAEVSATEVSAAARPGADVTAKREGIGRESGTAQRRRDNNNSDSLHHGFLRFLHVS
jgi:hypothetical protein